ncbi:MAG: hypothetical protein MRJ66_16380 [Nitrospira sp.]|nr:hypothetical protein [Nitrospira sp.]
MSAVMQYSPAVVIEFSPPSDGGGRRWSLTRRERQPSCLQGDHATESAAGDVATAYHREQPVAETLLTAHADCVRARAQ